MQLANLLNILLHTLNFYYDSGQKYMTANRSQRKFVLFQGDASASNSQIINQGGQSYCSIYCDPLSRFPFLSPTLLFGGREPWCNMPARLPGRKPDKHRHTVCPSALLLLKHVDPQIHYLTASHESATGISWKKPYQSVMSQANHKKLPIEVSGFKMSQKKAETL